MDLSLVLLINAMPEKKNIKPKIPYTVIAFILKAFGLAL